MLVLDGAYLVGTTPPVFRRIAQPGQEELQALVERIAERIGRALERQGVLARDAENSYLELDPEGGGPMADLLGHSVGDRVTLGSIAPKFGGSPETPRNCVDERNAIEGGVPWRSRTPVVGRPVVGLRGRIVVWLSSWDMRIWSNAWAPPLTY